jgi:hypothetical protein
MIITPGCESQWAELSQGPIFEDASLDEGVERELRELVLPYLEKCRPDGYDIDHALAAVYWMRKLIATRGGNERVLVPTMYLHDIGYSGLFKDGFSFAKGLSRKPLHAIRGANMITGKLRGPLTEIGFTQGEIDRMAHLTAVHDNLDYHVTHDERLVMESDTLGAVDYSLIGEDMFLYTHFQRLLQRRAPQISYEHHRIQEVRMAGGMPIREASEVSYLTCLLIEAIHLTPSYRAREQQDLH